MHARELVELAGLVSTHGSVLIHSGQPVPAQSIEQYWTTSKVRLERWIWRLKRHTEGADADARQRRRQWPETRGTIEEILTCEMLTRVWSAVLCACDRQRGDDETLPVARSVLIGHMEARHRALTLMARGQGIDAEAAQQLNQLRRRVERWTDLLVGYLACRHDVSELAFDPDRAREFAGDYRQRSALRGGGQAWPLALASLRAAFQECLSDESPNADLNARLASSILACFSDDLFDSTGLLRSLWMTRLTAAAEDTQGMIDDLLALERPDRARKPVLASQLFTDRRRRFGGKETDER